MNQSCLALAVSLVTACGHKPVDYSPSELMLKLVADVQLPGSATRFDYQDIDSQRGQLVVAHMNDNAVEILNLSDGSVLKELRGIPTPRGVTVASELGRVFVTSSPSKLVIINSESLNEIARVAAGAGPDGDAWDPDHKIVAISDQGDGAISLLRDSGGGARTQVVLGSETGNVVYDSGRALFWITVANRSAADELVAVETTVASITTRIALPGCSDAHGLRLHPDGQSAFVACEGNDQLARISLVGNHEVVTAATGAGPDVLSIDPGLGWLYVAAESGTLTVWDISRPGLVLVGQDRPGPNTHSVQVDPSTHRVFFPMQSGAHGKPLLRIMRPKSI